MGASWSYSIGICFLNHGTKRPEIESPWRMLNYLCICVFLQTLTFQPPKNSLTTSNKLHYKSNNLTRRKKNDQKQPFLDKQLPRLAPFAGGYEICLTNFPFQPYNLCGWSESLAKVVYHHNICRWHQHKCVRQTVERYYNQTGRRCITRAQIYGLKQTGG